MIRKLLAFICIFLCGVNAGATTYFVSASGSDANNGLSSGSPWASPNHAVNCGDVLQAAAGSYSAGNFDTSHWGTVSNCGTGNAQSVAKLKCVTFDACKISSSSSSGMQIDKSNWGIEGWEVTTSTGASLACFFVEPTNSSTSIHHVYIANSIANGCQNGGFSAIFNGSAGTDYIAFIGDIAYNAAQQGPGCASAFNIVNPVASDTRSGTHNYISQAFGFATVDGITCSTHPTDGEGLIFDSWFTNSYTQAAAVENNLFVGNGGRCFEVFKNNSGSGAPITAQNNTCWDNQTDLNQQPGGNLGEIYLFQSKNVTMTKNISKTNQANGPQGFAYYAYDCNTCDGSDSIAGNDGFSSAGNNYLAQFGSGFAYGSNLTTDPAFSSPSVPGAPSCGSSTNVINCMATVISNFAATGGGLTGYGYQSPSNTSINDPLFPAWLCNVNLPAGIVTPGCGVTPSGSGTGGVVIQ